VARSPAGIGDLELRIRGAEAVVGGTEVSGSISGQNWIRLVNLLLIRIRLGGASGTALVNGLAEKTGTYVRGTISGDIQYSNAAGGVLSRSAD
jgi:hypothetical protein